MNKLKLEALITSILIYFIIIATLLYLALYTPKKLEAKKYVEKQSEIIEVSLGSPIAKKTPYMQKIKENKKTSKTEPKPKEEKKIEKKVRNLKPKESKKTSKPKHVSKKTKPKKDKVKKNTTKKVNKKQSKKTKTKTKTKKSKKPNTSNLFGNISTNKIADDKPEKQSEIKGNAGKSIKKANQGRGVVDKYKARVTQTLKGWPAQSNFKGESVTVKLTIYPTGLFDYKIISRSLNPEFNRSLKEFLDQLKRNGFGAHSNPKAYNFTVDFIAK